MTPENALPKGLQIWMVEVGVTVEGDAPTCQSRWAFMSRVAIRTHILTRHALVPDQAPAFFRELGKRYPFGERARHPYKMWCAEVRVLKRLVAETPDLALTAEQLAIAGIARDRELEGDRDGAAALLLSEGMPDLNVGRCPVCGSAPTLPCANIEALVIDTPAQPSLFAAMAGVQHATLVVAHGARYKD